MFTKKSLFVLFSLLVIASLALTACGAKATEEPFSPAASQANDPHAKRLIELDPTYRSSGAEAWLKESGATWSALTIDARQPEEETFNLGDGAKIAVSGLQITATSFKVVYPACITTDRAGVVKTTSESRTYQPDLRNPSVLYTDVTLNGQATYYADCSNWGQLDPTK